MEFFEIDFEGWEEIHRLLRTFFGFLLVKLWRAIKCVDPSWFFWSEHVRPRTWIFEETSDEKIGGSDQRGPQVSNTTQITSWRLMWKRDNFFNNSISLFMITHGVCLLNLEFMYRCTRDGESWREVAQQNYLLVHQKVVSVVPHFGLHPVVHTYRYIYLTAHTYDCWTINSNICSPGGNTVGSALSFTWRHWHLICWACSYLDFDRLVQYAKNDCRFLSASLLLLSGD